MTSKLMLLIGKLSEGDCVELCRQFCKAPLSPIHPKHCHHHFYLQHQYSLNTSSSLSSSPLSSTPLSPSSAMSSTHPKHYLRRFHHHLYRQHHCHHHRQWHQHIPNTIFVLLIVNINVKSLSPPIHYLGHCHRHCLCKSPFFVH